MKEYSFFERSPYSGPPSPELDKAWESLLGPMNIRASTDELRRLDRSSVELPEGGELAWLEIFHELHCVVGFKK